ncbi:MAG: aminotransferase class V-fold PLP-dependent enzyme [Clostridia bacterium]|nr:aminotransferase class V-fold PLP-dependent enzyme [Clostridia bacterium]
MSKLAIYGGEKSVKSDIRDVFKWPIITEEDEQAVLAVLRDGSMSGTDITKQFEKEFSKWIGLDRSLGFSTGTAAIQGAMYGCKVGVGDEIICPTVTYWASCLQAYSLGATVVFANVDKKTLCIDPADIEHRISKRTKAIVVVHYLGHPCDMDAIMAVAKKHGVKVIEDVSHAQGALYKGEMVGTFGDVAAMSLMSGKSFAIGEGGILSTNNVEIYERALAFGHYARYKAEDIQTEELKAYAGLPLGGYKYRMHQMSSAVGRVQLKYYDERCREIRKSMNYFWDLLEGVPGLIPHRVDEKDGNTMGGWYAPKGIYDSKALGGLSVTRFCEAVSAEGVDCSPGANLALHTHSLLQTCDVYGHGKPTRIANADRDVRLLDESLAPSEEIGAMTYSIPWFKKFYPEIIEEYANAYKKVALNYMELLKDDQGNPPQIGGWHFFKHTKKD